MDTFRLKADMTFQAEDLDDAFGKLSEHFRKLKDSGDSDLIHEGKCDLGDPDIVDAIETADED